MQAESEDDDDDDDDDETVSLIIIKSTGKVLPELSRLTSRLLGRR